MNGPGSLTSLLKLPRPGLCYLHFSKHCLPSSHIIAHQALHCQWCFQLLKFQILIQSSRHGQVCQQRPHSWYQALSYFVYCCDEHSCLVRVFYGCEETTAILVVENIKLGLACMVQAGVALEFSIWSSRKTDTGPGLSTQKKPPPQ